MRSFSLLALLSLASFTAPAAFAWGCDGHMIVAMLTRLHLTPAVSTAVDNLLRANPIDPALERYCKDRPADPMVDASTWADDTRTPEKNGAWHFINIPRDVTERASIDAWCPPLGAAPDGTRTGCIVNALRYFVTILRDKTLPPADRATALRYVIHFVGDIHQPLHDIGDAGGNCITLQVAGDDRPTNLHSIWDSRLLQKEIAADKLDRAAIAAKLDSLFTAKYASLSSTPANDPESWAWDGSAIARNVAYGKLEPAVPLALATPPLVCDAEREQTQALHIVIGDSYIDRALPVIQEQLALAGFRLARLLNSIF